MNREQEIIKESIDAKSASPFSFQNGARWADKHPSKETIRAILAYYMTSEEPYYFDDDGDDEETERCIENIHEHFMKNDHGEDKKDD